MPEARPSRRKAADRATSRRRRTVVRDALDCAIDDLPAELQIDPEQGCIRLAGRRMLLLHNDVFSALRYELVELLGIEAARGLITRMGYLAGSLDAAFVRALPGTRSSKKAFLVGPELFALQGYGRIETLALELDLETGHNHGEFLWINSPEADAHIAAFGIGISPACWMETGYASGFGSAFMGKRILVREVECRAMGHAQCRSIAKPVEKWDDPERDLKYLIASGPGSSPAAPPVPERKRTKGAISPHAFGADEATETPIGASNAYVTTMHKIHRVAPTRATVLLLGESGVGKSILARQVHTNSTRAGRPFIEVNCATIPEQLIEAELFGVERGAYTGASATRQGRFEVADTGTLFLDEIALLTPTAQGKLLRVLQTGEMEHLGSTDTRRVDVRVVAATNVDLQTAIREGRFREDLFYRINVFPILVPPLRDRLDDIPVLLEHCLKKFARRHNRQVVGVTPFALQAIFDYHWPGNIREFENVIERGLILADDGSPIDVPHLAALGDAPRPAERAADAAGTYRSDERLSREEGRAEVGRWAETMLRNKIAIADVEDALFDAAVRVADGNIAKAAVLLGVPRGKLDYRFKKAVRANGADDDARH